MDANLNQHTCLGTLGEALPGIGFHRRSSGVRKVGVCHAYDAVVICHPCCSGSMAGQTTGVMGGSHCDLVALHLPGQCEAFGQIDGHGFVDENRPSSYTHLTLPTIYSV